MAERQGPLKGLAGSYGWHENYYETIYEGYLGCTVPPERTHVSPTGVIFNVVLAPEH